MGQQKSLALSQRKRKQQQQNSGDCGPGPAPCPDDLSRHEAARQDIDTLQNPDQTDGDQKSAQDS